MEDSIFTKIIKGEIPGEVIYQDEACFVLLTVQPLSEGHMMIIPRKQVDHLWNLDDATYHHLFDIAKQMQTKLKKAYPHYRRIGMLVEGFGVPHTHVHVFGYEQPLEETILASHERKQATGERFAKSADIKAAAEKLRF